MNMIKFLQPIIRSSNLIFETCWLPVLLLIGISSVNPESGVILALYIFYFIKLIESICLNRIPQTSLPQLFLIFGTIIIVILHYLYLKDPLISNNVFNWLILITSPFYLIKNSRDNSNLYRLLLIAIFSYFLYHYILETKQSHFINMGLSNPNIIAIIVLYLGFLLRKKHFSIYLFDSILICFILLFLDSKGGLLIFIFVNLFYFLKSRRHILIFAIGVFTFAMILVKFYDVDKLRTKPSFSNRIESFSYFLNYYKTNENQFIGNGFGEVALIADKTKSSEDGVITNIRKFNHVHNEIIESLIEGGILWLSILAISLVYFFYRNFIIKDNIRLKIIFVSVFFLSIQIYSSYRNGIIFSLVPLFCFSYGFRTRTHVSGRILNNSIFLFYLIIIPFLGYKSLTKFSAYENLRSFDLVKINESIHLCKNDPHLYYEKLKLILKLREKNYNSILEINKKEEFVDFDTEFYSTINKLNNIHPNYKSSDLIHSRYEFQKGNAKKAYKIIKESNSYFYDISVHYNLIYYASYIDERMLENEILDMFKKVIIIKNRIEACTTNYKVENDEFKVLLFDGAKYSIDIIKLKNSILNNRNKGFKALSIWLSNINKESFNLSQYSFNKHFLRW